MKWITADGKNDEQIISAVRSRSIEAENEVSGTVKAILEDVRLRGDAAVAEYTKRFDGMEPDGLELSSREIEEGFEKTSEDVVKALERAAQNIREYHERQKRESFVVTKKDGTVMGQRIRGMNRVGLYVPGGRAAYPSTVLMDAIPAKVAGVNELIMITPPSKSGVAPVILAAAKIAGVNRIFSVGGAQGIAALAYGTQSIPRVDKIVGPGNIYVAAAKRLVFGAVDIDMIAGPSEILVIADETADPVYLAADLMSQAEHDPMACAMLLTDSKEIARKTASEIENGMKNLSRHDIIKQSTDNYGAVILCEDIAGCIRLANEIAPEHLELMVKDPMQLLGQVENAGSVFLGRYSPEPLGDYFAGPNHVLPTDGTSRFFSPLSVDSFIKKSSFIYYSKEALERDSADIIALAEAEGLTAHANSIKVRRKT